MNRRGTAVLDNDIPVDLLHKQTEVTIDGSTTRWFVRGRTGRTAHVTAWVDATRLTHIQEDGP